MKYEFYFFIILFSTLPVSLASKNALKKAINEKIATTIQKGLSAHPDAWWKKRMDPFVGYPKPTFLKDPKTANEMYWFFPHTPLTDNLDEKLALPALGSFEFNIRRVAIVALTLVSTFLALHYRHLKLLENNSAAFHFARIMLYDFLLIATSQTAAFNLGNFLLSWHQKLIKQYPFFRTKKGDAVFKTIAYIFQLALPLATFYGHYALKNKAVANTTI